MINLDKHLATYRNVLETNSGDLNRVKQAESLALCLKNHFHFGKIECLETGASQNFKDGCFGFFLCEIINEIGGSFTSVDIDSTIIKNSRDLYSKHYPNLNISHFCMDSVTFLNSYYGTPNLVHLDSWDLDLKNPVPSMLHGWLEFNAIKDKMPSGSICIIDDNFMKGTWVDWNVIVNGELITQERIDIDYDVIGKGSLIYHWCKNYNTEWEIIGDHYEVGPNVKIILKKK